MQMTPCTNSCKVTENIILKHNFFSFCAYYLTMIHYFIDLLQNFSCQYPQHSRTCYFLPDVQNQKCWTSGPTEINGRDQLDLNGISFSLKVFAPNLNQNKLMSYTSEGACDKAILAVIINKEMSMLLYFTSLHY